jgi:hypothetical protein
MKKMILKTTATLLILAGGSFSCGKENNEYLDGIIPCNTTHKNNNTMEIKNLETNLYFLIRYPGIAPDVVLMPNDGIGYRLGSGILNYINSERIRVHCSICNFPDYAVKWNPKNENGELLGDALIEGKIDIIISGKVYIDSESEEAIVGTLELTSLKRKES